MEEELKQLLKQILQQKTPEQSLPLFHNFEQNRHSWSSYLMQLEQFFIVHGVTAENKKRAVLLSNVGEYILDILNKLFSDMVSRTYTDLTKGLTEYFSSKTHVLASRYEFHKTAMKPHQTYAEWVADLRGIAKNCKFVCSKSTCETTYVDELIRDVVVILTPHEHVRTACLQKTNPSLTEVLEIARVYETTVKTCATLKGEAKPSDVFKVNSEHATKQWNDKNLSHNYNKSCDKCEYNHSRSNCKFLTATCHKCNKKGHIATVCMSRSRGRSNNYNRRRRYRSKSRNRSHSRTSSNSPRRNTHSTNSVDEVENESFIFSIESTRNKISVVLQINDIPIQFQLDTGATCSMIGSQSYAELNYPMCTPTTITFKSYGGTPIPVKGKINVKVSFKDFSEELSLVVCDSANCSNILGLDWFDALHFRIIHHAEYIFGVESSDELRQKIQEYCKKHTKLFDATAIGRCNSHKADIKLKSDAQPKYFKPRVLPFAIQKSVKDELSRLVSLNILKPVQTSSWGTPIVPVIKPNGKIRICADYKVTVNPQVHVDRHPIPRIEELFYKLQGGQFFTKIDLRDAYLQLELTDESKKFLVINTPFGLFEFQRLPFGISSGPGIFQRLMEQITSDLNFCAVYLDDVIISGKTNDDHLKNLSMLLTRLEENGFRCHLGKCKFAQPEIEYLGHIISKNGIRPSTSGLKALRELPRPSNLKEVESFIGKINYYNKFIKNFSDVAAPLNQLRSKNAKFTWGEAQETSFNKLKSAIINAAQLVHFRNDYPLILATDSSSYGLGAVISHRYPDGTEYPIAFASKTLTDTQKRYSQIEKEALSIIYGVTKFNQYLQGRKFELVTDHKPLISLFNPNKKLPIHSINRLQRWAIILMNYEYTIIYKATNHHGNADALSRLPCGPDEEFDKNVNVCNSVDEIYQNIIDDYPIDYKSIAEHTLSDPVLCNVSKLILNGWPKKLPVYDEMSYSHFFKRSESLNIYNNVILLQTEQYTRIVIPSSLQQKTLNLLHEGHWGITRTKQIARRHCWWPSIDRDIEELIKACESCQLHASSCTKQFSPWPTTEKPWQRIHIDFAGPFLGKTYLVCVDSYTKFPFVIAMTQTTSASTIRALQQIFAIEGLPSTIVSDNGPQFTSAEFEQFCKANAIEHLTSAPFHPQSNGEAERFVRTFKTSMKKILHDRINVDMALMKFLSTYRTTPLPVSDKSPFELLHGRSPRTLLSAMLPSQEHRVKFAPTTKYRVNNKVYTLDFSTRGKKWRKGSITKCLGKKMYMVQTNHGEWKRHENQLRPRISTTDQTPPKSILRDTTTNTRNQNLSNHNNNIPVVLDFGRDDDIPPSTTQTPPTPENPMDDQPIVFRRDQYELRPKPHRI